jgi:GMP reductase
MSDGGIVHPGDIAKAIGAGADFVMVGSLFAGHTESPGELLLDSKTNEWYKTFYGMASEAAATKYAGGLKNYRTAEGKMVRIKHRGSLVQTLLDINGGIRSACTYINAANLADLQKNCEFVLVSETHNRSLS